MGDTKMASKTEKLCFGPLEYSSFKLKEKHEGVE